MTDPYVELIRGHRFRVTYQLDGQRKPRVFVGTYLGWSKYYTKHEFDLRPEAGTCQMPGEAIVSVEAVNNDVPHAQPVIVR